MKKLKNKTMKKKLLLLFVLINFSYGYSQDFTVGGISYSVIPSTIDVRVVDSEFNISSYTIPPTVAYGTNTYTVTEIGDYAFSFSTLTSITIPNTITKIGNSAFSYSPQLTTFEIPNSVISIGNQAFENCYNLLNINIPDSVTSIGEKAFQYCAALTTIHIPNSITSISNAMFLSCSGLTSINIPNSVTLIDDYAFFGCDSLTSITFPNSVTAIGYWAFFGCDGLTSITIPNSVTSIREFSFAYCSSLSTLIIPNSVTFIGNNAFKECPNLGAVICDIPTPIFINETVFEGLNYSNCQLIVPTESIVSYQNTYIWQLFDVSDVLSNSYFSIDDNVKLFPNPTQNELFVTITNLNSPKLEIIDLYGKVQMTVALSLTSNTINTSNLSNGMYLVKLTSDEGVVTKKIVKN